MMDNGAETHWDETMQARIKSDACLFILFAIGPLILYISTRLQSFLDELTRDFSPASSPAHVGTW